MNTEIRQGIDWVGCLDWNVRDFHDFDTPRGATYNSYLVRGEKNALIDAVKGPFVGFLLENIRKKLPLEKIDYVVCNHAETDHAGGLPELLKHVPRATLLCNEKCREALATFFDISHWNIRIVSPEDRVSLGDRTLAFVDTPMLHWPESMFTYIPEEKLLFSMDAFGQHLAVSVRFDDEWPLDDILAEAKSYYANIVTPYGKQVLKTLRAASQLDIDVIAPSHGLIWRKYHRDILSAYEDWALGTFRKKVLVLYDSMWGSTERMAEEIFLGAAESEEPVDVQLMHVRKTSLTKIAREMLDAPAVALGSSTLHGQMMPQMSALITYFKGLRFREKSTFAFGSSGWGIGGPEQIRKHFGDLKWTEAVEPIRSCNRPDRAVLGQCFQAGKSLAEIAAKAEPQRDERQS